MKRHIFYFVAIFLVIPLHSLTFAQQESPLTPLTATVEVEEVFGIEIENNFVDFGKALPGSSVSGDSSVTISCATNANVQWTLTVQANPPFTYQTYQIPNSNFSWEAALVEGSGQIIEAGGMSQDPQDVYIAGRDDLITVDPVELSVTFSLFVPQGTLPGKYQSQVTFSMNPEQ